MLAIRPRLSTPVVGSQVPRIASTRPVANPFIPPIPALTRDFKNLGACVEAIKASIESLAGQRGDAQNRAVTFLDLVDFGILNPSAVQSPHGSTDLGGVGTITGVIAGTGLSGGGATGSVTLNLEVPVSIANGGTGATTPSAALLNLGGAPLASPVFTGDPRAPTPAAADNDTSIATTAFVKTATAAAVGSYLPLVGGTITGVAPGYLIINRNTAALPPSIGNAHLWVNFADADTVGPGLVLDTHATNAAMVMRRANGTGAAPSAVTVNQSLGNLQFRGYGATSYSGQPAVRVTGAALENFTDTAQGAAFFVATNPLGGAAPVNTVQIDATAGLQVLSGNLSVQGTGGFIGNGTGQYKIQPLTGMAVLTLSPQAANQSATILLNQTGGGGQYSYITGAVDGTGRWQILMPNPGGDFQIAKNTGSRAGAVLSIAQSNGAVALLGTDTNDNAAVGYYGEVISALNSAGTALASGTPLNVASITLTPGDWDVDGNVQFLAGGAAWTVLRAWINTGSAAGVPTLASMLPQINLQTNFAALNEQLSTGTTRITVANGTTLQVNLGAQATFSGGTGSSAAGWIVARRMR